MEALTWKTRIAVLWIVAAVAMSAHMVLMILDPAALQLAAQWAATAGSGGWVFTAVFWLFPLWMAFVTVSARMPVNRWANLVTGILLTLLNIYHFFVCAVPLLKGGPYTEPTAQHILLVGSTVVATGLVTWLAWTWPQQEG
jgi:hypothetical protein